MGKVSESNYDIFAPHNFYNDPSTRTRMRILSPCAKISTGSNRLRGRQLNVSLVAPAEFDVVRAVGPL